MATLARKAKIPVYDRDGNLLYYEIDYVPMKFEKKLEVGGSRQQEIQLEADIRRHKRELGWKEPPRAKVICPICGKIVPKTHPTQKYCPDCGKLQKRKRATERMRKFREKKRKEKKREPDSQTK